LYLLFKYLYLCRLSVSSLCVVSLCRRLSVSLVVMNNVRGYCHEVVVVINNVRVAYQVVVGDLDIVSCV